MHGTRSINARTAASFNGSAPDSLAIGRAWSDHCNLTKLADANDASGRQCPSALLACRSQQRKKRIASGIASV
jgi:hypothetical protein